MRPKRPLLHPLMVLLLLRCTLWLRVCKCKMQVVASVGTVECLFLPAWHMELSCIDLGHILLWKKKKKKILQVARLWHGALGCCHRPASCPFSSSSRVAMQCLNRFYSIVVPFTCRQQQLQRWRVSSLRVWAMKSGPPWMAWLLSASSLQVFTYFLLFIAACMTCPWQPVCLPLYLFVTCAPLASACVTVLLNILSWFALQCAHRACSTEMSLVYSPLWKGIFRKWHLACVALAAFWALIITWYLQYLHSVFLLCCRLLYCC